jgi:superfamily II DNA or RNA helicase
MLRPHQVEIVNIARKIIAGGWNKRLVTADVIAGGGKSKMASLFANELLNAGHVSSVLHFVPRSALRDQVEADYKEASEFNPGGYRLIKSCNTAPLCSTDEVGVVASFDQLSANPDLYLAWARRRPTLVIFDEVHFLGDEERASWARAAVALADTAKVLLAMSGTIWRHDEKPIPLLEYGPPDETGRRRVKADITYSLSKAIGDRSIKPVEFVLRDGDVTWSFDRDEVEATLSTAERSDERAALRAFLQRPETWTAVVDDAVGHWNGWKREVYPSRMVVIAFDQMHAREIAKYLDGLGVSSALAISDNEDAHDVVNTFRKHGRPEVLVTVGMVSVGFDASDVTHLVYLSNWRSLPNFVQAIARAMRIDYKCSVPPGYQSAFAFAPDDRRLRMLVQWMRDEQAVGIKEREERERATPERSDAQEDAPVFTPIDGVPGAVSFEGLNGRIDDPVAREVEALLRECPAAAGTPPSKLADIIRWRSSRSTPAPARPAQTASELKGQLRAELHGLKTKRDRRLGLPFGTTAREEYKSFGKLDSGVTEDELRRRLEWVRRLG